MIPASGVLSSGPYLEDLLTAPCCVWFVYVPVSVIIAVVLVIRTQRRREIRSVVEAREDKRRAEAQRRLSNKRKNDHG